MLYAVIRMGPDGGGTVLCGEGPMLVDDEDSEAIIIAVDTLCLLNSPCPGFAMGIHTMVVVAVQGAPCFFLT